MAEENFKFAFRSLTCCGCSLQSHVLRSIKLQNLDRAALAEFQVGWGALQSNTGWTPGEGGAFRRRIDAAAFDAMDELWPNIDAVVLGSIQQLYPSPLRLQAAFDGFDDCSILIADLFPDMIEEDLRNTVAELSRWQTESAPALKRLRMSVVSESLYFLPSHRLGIVDLKESYHSITQSSTVVILELASKKKQRRYKEEPPDVIIYYFCVPGTGPAPARPPARCTGPAAGPVTGPVTGHRPGHRPPPGPGPAV